MSRKSSRRDFLKGRSAADALGDLAQGALPDGHLEPPGGGAHLVRISRRAMACEFEVFLAAGQYEQGTEAALEALDLVESLEDQMSVFRPGSELSRINRNAADGPVEVKPRLFALLELAARLEAETGGSLDITAGQLSDIWGFSHRKGALPDDRQLAEALENIGSELLDLDHQHQTVRFRKPGVKLNLGSIGKGHALDCCAEQLAAAGIGDFLLHGGGSSVWARGASPEDAGGGWTVGIRHPLRPNRRLAEIRLRDRALATSGSLAQFFRHKGRRYSHILDPRTGRPAEGVLSATAVASNAAEADALSTALFVMGPDAALEYCRDRWEIALFMVCPARHPGGIEIKSAGFEQEDLKILESIPPARL